MKTLKIIAIVMVAAALFFSCELVDTKDYGTIIINPSSDSSRTVVTGKVHDVFEDIKKDITYQFECTNEETGDTKSSAAYAVDKAHDVRIQLDPGTWVVSVKVSQKVFEDDAEIGRAAYAPVAVEAGQTVILKGIDVHASPYGKAIVRKVKGSDGAAFASEGYKDAKDLYWKNAATVNIDRYVAIKSDGGVEVPQSKPNYVYPQGAPNGTAKILWDDEHLYVLVLVMNAANSTAKGNNDHDTDSVEIFYSEDGKIGYQYRMNYAAAATYGYYNAAKTPKYDKPGYLDNCEDLYIIKTDLPDDVSYAVIAKIAFKGDTKKTGDKIGIDLQINGAPKTAGTPRSSVTVWYDKTGTAYEHPNLYKESLTLVD